MLRLLALQTFIEGYNSSSSKSDVGNFMSDGSENVLIVGTGKTQIYKGWTQRVGVSGAQVLMNAGDAYAGLGDYTEEGLGSVFKVLGALFYIGTGTLYYNGTDTGVSATTTLKLKKFTSGVLGTEYQAGSAQPSAPTIFAVTAPAGYTGKNDGAVSVKIARVRSATGGVSNASLSSNVVTATDQSIAVTFPSADANGQDYWEVDVTKNAEGAVGNHFYLTEIAESTLVETVVATATLDADTTIVVPNGTLTSSHIGWAYQVAQTEAISAVVPANITLGGNARCVVTAAGMSGSPVTVTFAVALNDTAAQVADKARAALSANANVAAFFNVGGSANEIILTARTIAVNDATMNFTLEDVTSTGITDDLTSTDVIATSDTQSYITAVGAADSGGAGYQQITLMAASATTANAVATFTRAVAGVLRTYVFEWYDADLIGEAFAPIRNFPPPAGLFGCSMEDVVLVDGCYGDTVNVVAKTATVSTTYRGNAIAVSDPAKPESYPPDNYIFTGDGVTALLPGGDGITWRAAQNSLGVIRYVGGSPAVSYERVWTGIGVRTQDNLTLGAGGRLYGYTGQRGAVRLGLGGEPDTLFAAPVADDMAGWTPGSVVLGTDSNYNFVFYGHNDTILAFYEPLGIWCAPIYGIGIFGYGLRSIVTINGAAYFCFSDDFTSIDLYDFNVGSGTTGKVTTPWLTSAEVSDIISRVGISGRFDTASQNVTVKVFTNGNNASPQSNQSIDVTATGYQPLGIIKPNVRMAKKYRIELNYASAGGDAGFDDVRVEGESQNIIW